MKKLTRSLAQGEETIERYEQLKSHITKVYFARQRRETSQRMSLEQTIYSRFPTMKTTYLPHLILERK
jgi:hypothetical protein